MTSFSQLECLFTAQHNLSNISMNYGGSPGLVIMGGGLCSNPGTVYYMDIFSHIFVVKIVDKRPGLALFLKNDISMN